MARINFASSDRSWLRIERRRIASILQILVVAALILSFSGSIWAQQEQSAQNGSSEQVLSEDEFVALFLEYSAAQNRDPESAEARDLEERFNEALAQREQVLATDANAAMSVLPGDSAPILPDSSAMPIAQTLSAEAVPTDDQVADQAILDLFLQFAEAQAADPNSAETAQLEQMFNEALALQELNQQTAGGQDAEAVTVEELAESAALAATETAPVIEVTPTEPIVVTPPAPQVIEVAPIQPLARSAETQLLDIDRPQYDRPQYVDPCDLLPGTGISNPDDVVQIRTEDGVLDMELLLEVMGREFGLSFLYDTPQGVTGQFRLDQYGQLRRRDLMPLLESLLSFSDMAMVREGSFIRIVPKAQSLRETNPPLFFGDEVPSVQVGDTVVTQILRFDYATVEQVSQFLANFTDPSTMVAIPNTDYVIFTEYASRMPRLLEMINLIDQPGPRKRLQTVNVTYLPASEAVTKVGELVQDLTNQGVGFLSPMEGTVTPSSGGGTGQTVTGPVIRADERTNRIFVIGTEEEINLVLQLMALLDVEGPYDQIRLEAMQVVNVLSEDVAEQIKQLAEVITQRGAMQRGTAESGVLPIQEPTPPQVPPSRRRQPGMPGSITEQEINGQGPFMLSDQRTNRLLVVGNEEQITLVERLLGLLDVPPFAAVQPIIEVYQPTYVEAREALDILDQLGITQPDNMRPRDRARSSDRDGSYGGYGSYGDRNYGPMYQPMMPMSPMMAQAIEDYQSLLPGTEDFDIKVAVQESSNKLFILATATQHASIADIMQHIDVEPNDAGAIRIYSLENRDPEDVASMLQDLLESDRTDAENQTAIPGIEGAPTIVALPEIYAVAVRGTQRQHEEIEEILKVMDRRLAQVLVEAILVQVTVNDNLDLGIQLQDSFDVGGTRRVSGLSPFGLSPALPAGGDVVTGTGGVLAFFSDQRVYATLEALQTVGNTRVTSEPRVLVNDNQEGTITSKRSEPTTTSTIQPGSDTPIVTFDEYVDAGTTLTIKPHISEGNFIQLDISLSVDSFDGTGSANVPPPKSSNEIHTVVNVPDGMTIVLGGLTTSNDSVTVNKIPLLGDLPLIGSLFRNVSRGEGQTVLYVFVRSQIVRSRAEEGNADFQDLELLSQPYRQGLRNQEQDFNRQNLIPGVESPFHLRRPSVLDE
ncbi:MAG: hypothetical protein JW936_01680 [Sedimentisphaerales bacterium]|nr:hypothetical protein [Sedimentisphaerales bacterium]